MPSTVNVTGTVTLADDGTVTGALTLAGGRPAAEEPAGPAVDPGQTPAEQAPTVTEPAPADMPPYAPDVPAGEPPAAIEDPLPGDAPAEPATTGADVPAWPGRELRRNDAQRTPDADVREWQQAASDLGFTGVGAVDGFFGPKTEAAVKALQERAGIDTTGVIGAGTWELPFTADPETAA